MKIAIVRNQKTEAKAVIARLGQPCPEFYSEKTIQTVAESLSEYGHTVGIFEADINLLNALAAFMPSGADGRPGGLVFNMAYGIQGECRYTHVPSALEMAGLPYTGSGPLGHTLALDKVITKILIRDAGVPTPRYRVLTRAGESARGLKYPMIVKPRHESTSFGLRLVRNRSALASAVEEITQKYQQEALVEEFIDGREICVGLLGNQEMEYLPLVECSFGDRSTRLVTWEDKNYRSAGAPEPEKICPAPVDEALAAKLRKLALATFRACHCRDYARVDIRLDQEGNPHILEINSMASLGLTGSYVRSAETAGYSYAALVQRIVEVARDRYETVFEKVRRAA